VDLEADELGCEVLQPRVIAFGPPEVDQDVFALDVAEVAKAGAKSL
jgi:hypothetical protein